MHERLADFRQPFRVHGRPVRARGLDPDGAFHQYEEAHRYPGALEARSSQRPIAIPPVERLGTADRGITLTVQGELMSAQSGVAVDERSQAVIAGIEAVAPRYVLHLPSSTLKAIVQHFLESPDVRTFPIPREEEGIGILAGLALAGQPAVMIIQDNGIGNMLTATTTFPQAYHIPLLVVVARRGGLGEYNSMIHTISEHAESVLEAADLRYFQLDGRTPIEAWAPTVVRAYEYARITHRPIFLLVNLMGG